MHPVLLHIGNWELRSYGLFVAIAMLIGTWWSAREGKRMEFFRAEPPTVAGIVIPQALSVLLVAAGITSILMLRSSLWARHGSPVVDGPAGKRAA